jgi:hypothetical protein
MHAYARRERAPGETACDWHFFLPQLHDRGATHSVSYVVHVPCAPCCNGLGRPAVTIELGRQARIQHRTLSLIIGTTSACGLWITLVLVLRAAVPEQVRLWVQVHL